MKKFLYIILGILLLYFTVRLATCKEKIKENKELLNRIDSLNQVSKQLQEEQKRISLNDSIFNNSINKIDNKIDSINDRKTVIKQYYHTQIQNVPKYNSPQLDSFFKSRYNY